MQTMPCDQADAGVTIPVPTGRSEYPRRLRRLAGGSTRGARRWHADVTCRVDASPPTWLHCLGAAATAVERPRRYAVTGRAKRAAAAGAIDLAPKRADTTAVRRPPVADPLGGTPSTPRGRCASR